jgi:hypothetical protein
MDRENENAMARGYLVVTILVLAAVGLLPLGCTTTTQSGTTGSARRVEAPARAVQHPTLSGIPLPTGFELVEDRSFLYSSGQVRHASCEFVGGAQPTDVSRFYKEHMASAGFTLRQERFDRGEYVLDFDGNSERSEVRIRRTGFKTSVIINVSPTPKGPVERDRPGAPR